jgi:hypothetical protein
MIADWPLIRRGTDCTVPIMPGFVIVTVVPVMSSGDRRFSFTRWTSDSYAARNPAKSTVSAFRMFGTTSVREPSSFLTSTARPRLTCSCCETPGPPLTSAYARLMAGESASARTTAQAIRWVKLTLPLLCEAR